MDRENLECFNGDVQEKKIINGNGTAVDLTDVCETIAGKCWWEEKESIMGFDHYQFFFFF